MKRYVSHIILILAAAGLMSCQRAIENSSITIETPKSLDSFSSEKTGALEAIPAEATLCYMINVTASNMDVTSAATDVCSPTLGLVSSVVKGGSTIKLDVPRGSGRKFELFLYLLANSADPCPEMGSPFNSSLLPNTYLVGSAKNVDISSDTVNLTIKATFPGVSQNIAKEFNMPASCLPAAPGFQNLGLSVSTAQGKISGGNFKMEARVGRPQSAPVLSNGTYKLKVNVISQ